MLKILEVNSISKSYNKKAAVEQVSFNINSGEAFGLLGPNGAGKSTIIHMIAGILSPDIGDIHIGGNSIKKQRKKAQKLIGVVPQELALYPTMSAESNLRFFGKLYGLTGNRLTNKVEESLNLVGLYERRKEPVERYSGGMKRRINIAVALLHEPKLLIMDEPTVGIDPQSRSHILETVKKLQLEKGVSVLYTSHYMEEVETICDRVGIIDHGKLIAEGTISELRDRYGDQSQLKISLKDYKKAEENLDLLNDRLNISIEVIDNGFVIMTKNPDETLPKVMDAFNNLKCEIRSIHILEPNLETIFLSLTGRSLRDE